MTTATRTIVTTPAATPSPLRYVQPTELCNDQRRGMVYDAFSALQAAGL